MSQLRAVLFDIDDTLFGTTDFAGRARKNAVRAMCEAGLDLPTYEELEDACVLVSKQLSLCAKPNSPADDDMCSIDEQFSDFCGEPVYLCRT